MSVAESRNSDAKEQNSNHSWIDGSQEPPQMDARTELRPVLSKIEETGASAEKTHSNILMMPSSIMPNSEMRIEENLLGEDTLCMIQPDGEMPGDAGFEGSQHQDSMEEPDQRSRQSAAYQLVQFDDSWDITGYETVKTLEGGPFGCVTLCRTKDHRYFYLKKGLALSWEHISALRQQFNQGEHLISPKLIATATGASENLPYLDIHNAIIPAEIDWNTNIAFQPPFDMLGKGLSHIGVDHSKTVFRDLMFVNTVGSLKNLIHHRLSHEISFQEFEILNLIVAFSEAMKSLENSQRKHAAINLETLMVDYKKPEAELKFFLLDPEFIVPSFSTVWQFIKAKKCYPSPELLKWCGECQSSEDVRTTHENVDSVRNDIYSLGLIVLEIMGGGEEPSYLTEEGNQLDEHLISQKMIIARDKYSENLINLVEAMLSDNPNLRPGPAWLKMRAEQLLQIVSLSRMQSPEKVDEFLETHSNPDIGNFDGEMREPEVSKSIHSLQQERSNVYNTSAHEKSGLEMMQASPSTQTWTNRHQIKSREAATGEIGAQQNIQQSEGSPVNIQTSPQTSAPIPWEEYIKSTSNHYISSHSPSNLQLPSQLTQQVYIRNSSPTFSEPRVVSIKRYLIKDGQRILIGEEHPNQPSSTQEYSSQTVQQTTVYSRDQPQAPVNQENSQTVFSSMLRGIPAGVVTTATTIQRTALPDTVPAQNQHSTVEVIKPRRELVHSLSALKRSVSPPNTSRDKQTDIFGAVISQTHASSQRGCVTTRELTDTSEFGYGSVNRTDPIDPRQVNCATCLKHIRLQASRDRSRAEGSKQLTARSTRRGNSPSTNFSKSPAREGSPKYGTRFCAIDASQADIIDSGPSDDERRWRASPRSKMLAPAKGMSNRMVFGELYYDHSRKCCNEVCRKYPDSIKPAKKPIKAKPSQWTNQHPDFINQEFARREMQKLKEKERQEQYARMATRYGYTPRAGHRDQPDSQNSSPALDDSYL